MRLSQDWVLPFLGERKVKFEQELEAGTQDYSAACLSAAQAWIDQINERWATP